MSRKSWLFALLVLASAAAVYSQQHTVTRVGIVVRPRSYDGRCPADLLFTASIHVSHPSAVEFQWERSDGAHGERQRADIRGAGLGVSDHWHLGGHHQRLVVWERLHVLAPTGIYSPMARIAVNCR